MPLKTRRENVTHPLLSLAIDIGQIYVDCVAALLTQYNLISTREEFLEQKHLTSNMLSLTTNAILRHMTIS